MKKLILICVFFTSLFAFEKSSTYLNENKEFNHIAPIEGHNYFVISYKDTSDVYSNLPDYKAGFKILDLTQPSNPVTLSDIKLNTVLSSNSSTESIVQMKVVNDLLFVATVGLASYDDLRGVHIFDISSPMYPIHLSHIKPTENIKENDVVAIDIFTKNSTITLGVLTKGYQEPIRLYDVTNPLNPTLKDTITRKENNTLSTNHAQIKFFEDAQKIFVSGDTYIRVYDITGSLVDENKEIKEYSSINDSVYISNSFYLPLSGGPLDDKIYKLNYSSNNLIYNSEFIDELLGLNKVVKNHNESKLYFINSQNQISSFDLQSNTVNNYTVTSDDVVNIALLDNQSVFATVLKNGSIEFYNTNEKVSSEIQPYSLKSGWNLISVNSSISTSEIPDDISYIWAYINNTEKWSLYTSPQYASTNNYGYTVLDSLEPNKGYWIYNSLDIDTTIPNTTFENTVSTITVNPLWNLLGTSSKTLFSSDFSDEISTVWTTKTGQNWSLYTKNNETTSFQSIEKIEPNSGFWVYSNSQIDVNLTKSNYIDENTTVISDGISVSANEHTNLYLGEISYYTGFIYNDNTNGLKLVLDDPILGITQKSIPNTQGVNHFKAKFHFNGESDQITVLYKDSTNRLSVVTSMDKGDTWSNPKQFDTLTNTYGNLDVYNDTIAVCYHNHNTTYGLNFAVSKDKGNTWDTYNNITEDEAGYSCDVSLGYDSEVSGTKTAYISHATDHDQKRVFITTTPLDNISFTDYLINDKSNHSGQIFSNTNLESKYGNLWLTYFNKNSNEIVYEELQHNPSNNEIVSNQKSIVYKSLNLNIKDNYGLNLKRDFSGNTSSKTAILFEDNGLIYQALKPDENTKWEFKTVDKSGTIYQHFDMRYDDFNSKWEFLYLDLNKNIIYKK